MRVLGIESATSVCAVALCRDGLVEREELLEREHVHAGKLLTLVEKVLHDGGLRTRELQGIAVSIGPGSFTGLRIGLSAAKGLVFGTGTRLVGVPTLEALARKAARAALPGLPEHVLAVLDARRDDFYCQLFRAGGGTVTPCWPARDLSAAEVMKEIENLSVLITGDGRRALGQFLETRGVDPAAHSLAGDDLARCSAGTVALIGEELLRQGRADDPALLEPRYIKEFFLQQRTA